MDVNDLRIVRDFVFHLYNYLEHICANIIFKYNNKNIVEFVDL